MHACQVLAQSLIPQPMSIPLVQSPIQFAGPPPPMESVFFPPPPPPPGPLPTGDMSTVDPIFPRCRASLTLDPGHYAPVADADAVHTAESPRTRHPLASSCSAVLYYVKWLRPLSSLRNDTRSTSAENTYFKSNNFMCFSLLNYKCFYEPDSRPRPRACGVMTACSLLQTGKGPGNGAEETSSTPIHVGRQSCRGSTSPLRPSSISSINMQRNHNLVVAPQAGVCVPRLKKILPSER